MNPLPVSPKYLLLSQIIARAAKLITLSDSAQGRLAVRVGKAWEAGRFDPDLLEAPDQSFIATLSLILREYP